MKGAWGTAWVIAACVGLVVGCGRGGAKQAAAQAASVQASATASAGPSGAAAPSAEAPAAERDPPDKSACAVQPKRTVAFAKLFGQARQLRARDELDALMSKGKAGAPERLALHLDGTGGVMCECPPLQLNFADDDSASLELLDVSVKGAPSGPFKSWLKYVAVGYFSGAWIDTYESFRVAGVDIKPGEGDDEERSYWPELHPEFCLEAYCYVLPDLTPAPDADEASRDWAKELEARAAQDAADLRQRGIRPCERTWLRKSE